ncbi:MAG: hypothetical protein AAF560_24540, partial [Acidobacteriota bacterium]
NQANLASLAMLAYLALVTFVILRHSMRVLEAKRDPTLLDTWLDRGLALGAIGASVAIVAFAALRPTSNSIVLYAMSPIGLSTGFDILRYVRGGETSPRAWFYQHLGATLGAGIAFHTAFAVFGASRLFDLNLSGVVSVLPWILPTAIGLPGILLWKRHYRRKFGELTPRAA